MTSIGPSILRNDPLLLRVWQQLGRPTGCRITGGYVRDRLLGRPSNDLDLTIDREVDGAQRPARLLARALGVRAHLLGTDPNRIWRIETAELKVELWPLGELGHEDDLRRRDFSCNALSWELPGGPLVDLVGGLDDLREGRLRAISRANLEDDPVRLLRAARFLAQLPDFELDGRSRDWVLELGPRLADAPRERVGQELLLLLRGPAARRGILECLDLGLLDAATPEPTVVDEGWLRAHLTAADRLCGADDDAARLAFLFRAWKTADDSQLTPYAWPKSEREGARRAAMLLDDAMATVDASAADRREVAWRAGPAFPTLIALAAALEPGRPGWRRWWRQWRRDPRVFTDPRPLLSGDEIGELAGIEPGPGLGEVVDSLTRAQIRGEVRSRAGAVRWLRRRRRTGR